MRNHIKFVSLLTAIVMSVLLAPSAHAGTGTSGRYITGILGRNISQYAGPNCTVLPGTLTATQVVKYAKQVDGVVFGGNVIAARTKDHSRLCMNSRFYQSVDETNYLKRLYGYTPQTSGMTYKPFLGLTADEQRYEACGVQNWMRAHGWYRSDAIFAAPFPPDRPALDDAAMSVVLSCYAFGRDYGANTYPYQPKRTDGTRIMINDMDNLNPEHYYRTVSMNGGSCPEWVKCGDGRNYTYMPPWKFVRDLVDAPPGSHYMLQGYSFVSGDSTGRWKCSGAVSTHWTSEVEMYCWNDMKAILDNIPDDYISTDPKTVLQIFGYM